MSWTESDSKDFIDFGDYFIPYREQQAEVIRQLLSAVNPLNTVVDLCCGEGFWCKKILTAYPKTTVYGLDISEEMLRKASKDLVQYKERFNTQKFDLRKQEWRYVLPPVDAFISSLAIHHLEALEKQQLYSDLYNLLNDGGALLISDLISPTVQVGYDLAGKQWEDYVRRGSIENDNPAAYQEFLEDKWNFFYHPEGDPIDQPSGIFEQLEWLNDTGFKKVDVYWMFAGHAIFGGWK